MAIFVAFTAICNELFKLKLMQDFRIICTCIFVTTDQDTEQDSKLSSVPWLVVPKVKVIIHENFWGSLSLKSLLQIEALL